MASAVFDRVEAAWESPRTRRAFAVLLVAVFGAVLLGTEAARRGLLPPPLRGHLPGNHFHAIEVAFWLLLAYEVVGLVLGVARSVANAAGKQFEIFSLILLRHSFEEFGHIVEPIVWAASTRAVLHMLSNAFGALALFVIVGFYYSAQRHRPISDDPGDTRGFIAAKKAISLLLIAVFAGVAARAAVQGTGFFETFYTVLVFADVLLVLLSLRYSSSYHVVFRNSGLAVATVLLRLALAAPPFWNAALGVAAALFALVLTLAYNRFGPVLRRTAERDEAARARIAG